VTDDLAPNGFPSDSILEGDAQGHEHDHVAPQLGHDASAFETFAVSNPVKYLARRQRLAVWGNAAPVLPQPAYWAPCNHCGMCCISEPCWIGRMLFEAYEGECPALQWTADGSSCGLMARPAEFMPVRVRIEGAGRVREAARTLIGSRRGCGVGGKRNEKTSAALKILGLAVLIHGACIRC